MKITGEQGKQSNFFVTVAFEQSDYPQAQQEVIKDYQKELTLPGFRQGHVPLDMVEKNIQPQYLAMAVYEKLVHISLDKVLEQFKEIKFIGQPYDLQLPQGKDDQGITYKLDIYPSVTIKNKNRESETLPTIDQGLSKEEVQDTMNNLKSQFATFNDVDTITEKTVTKLKFNFKDKDENAINKGSAFIDEKDFQEFETLKKQFIGKKVGETINFEYKEKELPHVMHFHQEGTQPTHIECEITAIQEKVLPEFTQDSIKQLFPEMNFDSIEAFENHVKKIVEEEKFKSNLHKAVDEYIKKISSSLEISVPQTMIEEEMKIRHQNLEKRMGGAEHYKQYIQHIGPEQEEKLKEDLKQSAKSSLENFFIFQKLLEHFEIKDVDWKKDMDAEIKLYEKLQSSKK